MRTRSLISMICSRRAEYILASFVISLNATLEILLHLRSLDNVSECFRDFFRYGFGSLVFVFGNNHKVFN